MQVFPDYSTLCKLSKHVFGQSICKQWYEQIIDVPPERIPDSMVPFLWTGVLCEDQSPSVWGYSVICFTVQVLMPLSTTSNCKPFHCSPKRSSVQHCSKQIQRWFDVNSVSSSLQHYWDLLHSPAAVHWLQISSVLSLSSWCRPDCSRSPLQIWFPSEPQSWIIQTFNKLKVWCRSPLWWHQWSVFFACCCSRHIVLKSIISCADRPSAIELTAGSLDEREEFTVFSVSGDAS